MFWVILLLLIWKSPFRISRICIFCWICWVEEIWGFIFAIISSLLKSSWSFLPGVFWWVWSIFIEKDTFIGILSPKILSLMSEGIWGSLISGFLEKWRWLIKARLLGLQGIWPQKWCFGKITTFLWIIMLLEWYYMSVLWKNDHMLAKIDKKSRIKFYLKKFKSTKKLIFHRNLLTLLINW